MIDFFHSIVNFTLHIDEHLQIIFEQFGMWTYVVLIAAAVIGDGVNYAIGSFLGPKVFQQNNSRIFKKEYLDRTHRFYEKYGAKTIVIARFVPIVRTFAPFVAGFGRMSYLKF